MELPNGRGAKNRTKSRIGAQTSQSTRPSHSSRGSRTSTTSDSTVKSARTPNVPPDAATQSISMTDTTRQQNAVSQPLANQGVLSDPSLMTSGVVDGEFLNLDDQMLDVDMLGMDEFSASDFSWVYDSQNPMKTPGGFSAAAGRGFLGGDNKSDDGTLPQSL